MYICGLQLPHSRTYVGFMNDSGVQKSEQEIEKLN